MMWRKFVGMLLLGAASNAWAGAYDVLVENAWLRESVPGQSSASLQLHLTSTRPARLVAVATPLAEAVKIQRLFAGQGKLKAREVGSQRLPRNRAVVFGERGIELMLTGLKHPLNVGDHIPITLTVEFANKHTRKVEVEAEVRALDLSYMHYSGDEVHDHR